MQSLPPALLRPAATAPVPAVPAAAPPIIQMDGVSRHFGDLVAVRDVSLSVPQGSILGMIGPSGSGKTTIVRMLTGTLGPSAGSLSVLGQVPLHFNREARERIAYMPQLFSLYPDLTAKENMNFLSLIHI